MIRYAFVSTAVISAVFALPAAALAQGKGQGPVARACGAEIANLCAGKEHGGGAVRSCLSANRAKLSEGCRVALDNTGPGRGRGQGRGM
jgi:hypothetical protein